MLKSSKSKTLHGTKYPKVLASVIRVGKQMQAVEKVLVFPGVPHLPIFSYSPSAHRLFKSAALYSLDPLSSE